MSISQTALRHTLPFLFLFFSMFLQKAKIVSHHSEAENNEQESLVLTRVKDWINSHQLETLDLTYIRLKFPDISAVVLSEKIMDQLEKGCVISKTGKGTYIINRDKVFNPSYFTNLI
ncbi:hypothetical protein ISN45_Aa07g008580 [Arabidopsis thaliana x Arabidopsis arenosa]|uniref:Uncharacterized protein n=1 Tax=Arabidopsis thaliana x Arabidopsis arenosa TaxID=1240361 RepID=A0A8T1Y5V3_9BRAS|nr:hypothetical protein ISN45_Aa07g008580 [Arabidopsis thaliana x Arabidopsis arenosa]